MAENQITTFASLTLAKILMSCTFLEFSRLHNKPYMILKYVLSRKLCNLHFYIFCTTIMSQLNFTQEYMIRRSQDTAQVLIQKSFFYYLDIQRN